MIQKFTISNFGSIRESLTLSFEPTSDDLLRNNYINKVKEGVELLRFAIIYGNNGSGKSTVLRAFSFFCRMMLNKPLSARERIAYKPFALDDHSARAHSSMELVFWLKGVRHIAFVEFDRTRIYKETLIAYYTTRATTLYLREYVEKTQSNRVTFGMKTGLNRASQQTIIGNTTANCSVMAAFGESNVKKSLLNDVNEYFFEHLGALLHGSFDMKDELKSDKEGKKKQFILHLLEKSDFNVKNLHIEEQEEELPPMGESLMKALAMLSQNGDSGFRDGKYYAEKLILTHQGDNGLFTLSEEDESTGTLRYMRLGMTLYHLTEHPRFCTLDEIETSLHAELVSYFIKSYLMLNEGESQLIVTTNDVTLLSERFLRRDVVWFAEKDKCGATQIKRLSAYPLHKSLSPYNAYVQGKLAKLPALEDDAITSQLKGEK